jgi:hypothetical protein
MTIEDSQRPGGQRMFRPFQVPLRDGREFRVVPPQGMEQSGPEWRRSTLIVVPDGDGVAVFAGKTVAVDLRQATWLILEGPIDPKPSQEHLSLEEFKTWVLGLREAGYIFRAHDAKGRPVNVCPD